MQKEFVPYTLALELKELGFNESCFGVYSEFHKTRVYEEQYIIEGLKLPAPTFSQSFRFFREKHNLPNHIHTMWQNDWNDYSYQWHITEDKKEWNCIEHFKTYEECELACLIKLIQIVKDGNK